MAESLSPLKRWLHFVDEQLSAEAVEYLKLGLHSEFFPLLSEVQKLEKPSQLYYFLLERCMRGSESKTLKMFAHVVRGLGGSLRGNYVTTEAFGVNSKYNVRDPGPFNLKKASVNFKFFQCLLKISVKARRTALSEQLKKKFSKSRFLNINHRQIKNLSEMFIKLFQMKFIAANNTHHLVEALYKYRAWLCLRVLDEYHKSIGLQSIPLAQGMEAYICATDYSSSDPSSVDDSSDNILSYERTRQRSYYEGTELEFIDENDPAVFSYRSTVAVNNTSKTEQEVDSDSDVSIIDSSETDVMMKKDAARGQLSFGNNRIMVIDSTGKRSSRVCKIGIACLSIFLFLVVIVSIVFTVTLWLPLRPPATLQVPVLQHSKIVLTEVDAKFHRTVTIAHERGNLSAAKSDAAIDFYYAAMSCDHMMETDVVVDRSATVYLASSNISGHVPMYALKESKFKYYLTGNDSTTKAKVCVYNFDTNTKMDCKKLDLTGLPGYFHVHSPGYYFFKVDTLGHDAPYLLTISADLKILNMNTDHLFDCEINSTNNFCQLDLPTTKKTCLLAEFYPTASGVSEMKLEVRVKDKVMLLLTLPLSLVACALFIISAGFLVLVIFCCARIRKLYRHSTVV